MLPEIHSYNIYRKPHMNAESVEEDFSWFSCQAAGRVLAQISLATPEVQVVVLRC